VWLYFIVLQATTAAAAAPLLAGASGGVADEGALNPWASRETASAPKFAQKQSLGQTSDVTKAAAAATAEGPLASSNVANWPICCPITRVAISEDVQSLYRGTVKTAYVLMLLMFSAVFVNTLATLVLWLAPHTPPGILTSGLNFGISWIYTAVAPLCAFWHFTYLYSSMRYPSPGRNTCFIVFLFLGIAFDTVAITGIPRTGLCGIWTLATVAHKDVKGPTEVQSIFVLCVTVLFSVHLLVSLWLARSVRQAGTILGALAA